MVVAEAARNRAARIVPAVDRAARVLGLIEAAERPLGISDLARRLEASKGSVHDVLETLRAHGLLARDDASKQYRLGPRLVRLGAAAAQGVDLAREAEPHLRRLAAETRATALLLVPRPRDGRAVIVATAQPEGSAMGVAATVGGRIPLLAGASGKVFLAFDVAAGAAPATLPAVYTERTIVDLEAIRQETAAVRHQGWAVDDREYLEGVRAVAAPVFDARGEVIAALLAVGLAGALTTDRLPATIAATTHAAAALSFAVGAPEPPTAPSLPDNSNGGRP